MEQRVLDPVHQVETRPEYETPSIRVMNEQDILNTFQITQSMGVWWVHNSSPSCTA